MGLCCLMLGRGASGWGTKQLLGALCSWLWTRQQEYNHPLGFNVRPAYFCIFHTPKTQGFSYDNFKCILENSPFPTHTFEGHLSVTWLKLVALLAVLGMKVRVSYRLRTSHPPSYIPILSLSALSWHAQGPFPLMVRCLAKLICIISSCLPYFLPLWA